MDIQNMKNIIVLRNLPSNMVEEAFVVLKDNVKVHKEELIDNKKSSNNSKNNSNKRQKNDKDYVVKEAEMLVKDYIDKIEKRQFKTPKDKLKLEEKCKRLKYSNIFFILFSIFSIISIILR